MEANAEMKLFKTTSIVFVSRNRIVLPGAIGIILKEGKMPYNSEISCYHIFVDGKYGYMEFASDKKERITDYIKIL